MITSDGAADETTESGGPVARQTRARGLAFNWDQIDEYVAMDISLMTEADIPTLTSRHPESEHWIGNYFLNSQLRGRFKSPTKEYVFTFLRRTMNAFEEYELAKEKTEEFVATRAGQPVMLYLSALHHWEQCMAAAWQGIEVWTKMTGKQAFENGQGEASLEEKLNHMYNRSKHTAGGIKSGQLPERGSLAVWLTNDGLRSTEHLLTWADIVETLDDLARVADKLQDPKTAAGQ